MENISGFRRKAAQFEESEYNSESDSSQTLDECCSHCECSGVMKKAQDLLNYTPESNFLKKLKKQSEMAHGEGHNKNRRPVNESLLDDNGCSGCGCKVNNVFDKLFLYLRSIKKNFFWFLF